MLFTKSHRFRHSQRAWLWGMLTAALLLGAQGPASAETLKEALAAAYLYNPTLKAARAQLRATDNGVSQAKSGYRPTVSATAQDGWDDLHTKLRASAIPQGSLPVCPGTVTAFSNPAACTAGFQSLPLSSLASGQAPNGQSNSRLAQITATETLFDGFRTYNNVKGAEALVEAGREDLRNAEINVLLNAATAYMNVVRDAAIVRLRQNNVKVLAEQLRATEDRFKVGEVTRTDVAQAQSGLASAQADLSIAQGTLYGDQALFAQYIGHPAANVRDPGPPTKLLPKSLQAAIDIAEAENPGFSAQSSASALSSIKSRQSRRSCCRPLPRMRSTELGKPAIRAPSIGYEAETRSRPGHSSALRGRRHFSADPPSHREPLAARQNIDVQRET